MQQLLTETIEYLRQTAHQSDLYVENTASFRALSQLDARAANGESLDVIDETALRTKLECEVSTDRERSEAVKSKILQALAMLECPDTVHIEADDFAIATEPRHEAAKAGLEDETPIDIVDVQEDNNATCAASHDVASDLLQDDDLCLIDGIDCDLALRLKQHDVCRYSQIAQWSRDDIGQVADEKLSARQIAKENWIEQAAVLAGGKHTLFAKRALRKLANKNETLPVKIASEVLENRSLVVVAQPQKLVPIAVFEQAITVGGLVVDDAEQPAILASAAFIPVSHAARQTASRGIVGTVSLSIAACTILLAAVSMGSPNWSKHHQIQMRPSLEALQVTTPMDEFEPIMAALP